MRTKPGHIINGCVYCDEDHDPAIECREMPESTRFQLSGPRPKATKRIIQITDASGKLTGVRTEWEQEP